MSSHVTLIERWPSLSEFAADIGQSYNTAKAIKRRGRIPSWHWNSCVEGAKRRGIEGVTLEALAETSPKPGRSDDPPADAPSEPEAVA